MAWRSGNPGYNRYVAREEECYTKALYPPSEPVCKNNSWLNSRRTRLSVIESEFVSSLLAQPI